MSHKLLLFKAPHQFAVSLPMLIAATQGTHAASNVSVEFVNPGSYTDAADNDTNGREAVERNLTKLHAYLEELGKRYLRDGQSLSIRILDVDLAGQYEPWRSRNDHERYYRATTWPKITLAYTLSTVGQRSISGMEAISDNEYRVLPNPLPESDNLRYEKKMLDDWFRTKLAGKLENLEQKASVEEKQPG